MIGYVSEYRVIGEIADFLLLKRPTQKLLVDISPDRPGHEAASLKKYPNRTTHTVLNSAMIARIMSEIEVGDTVEVSGTFEQSNYVPYRTTHIDTTFLLCNFKLLKKASGIRRQETVSRPHDFGILHRPAH